MESLSLLTSRSILAFVRPRTVTKADVCEALERACPFSCEGDTAIVNIRWAVDDEPVNDPTGAYGEMLIADVDLLIAK
jgi:cell division ATPase FtsA